MIRNNYLATHEDTYKFGIDVAKRLHGGEVIELIGDIGAGKTTLVKGLAHGMGIKTVVQSPSYTISQQYEGDDNLSLHHYDLYRLHDPGLVQYDVQESMADPCVVTVIEWADTVRGVLPEDRITIRLDYKEQGRGISLSRDI